MAFTAICNWWRIAQLKDRQSRDWFVTKTIVRVMQLTAIIFFGFALTLSARSTSQTITLDVRDSPLKSVFSAVESQTGYVLVASKARLSAAERITVNVSNMALPDFLALILKDQPYDFEIKSKTIFIKAKSGVGTLPSPQLANHPPITVKGRIVDSNGKPIIATVTVKGTGRGVVSDDNGAFVVHKVNENAILIISGINIETFEVAVNGRHDLSELIATTKIATEQEVLVEVNTGYQRIPKERSTGSFAIVDNELFNRNVSPTVLGRLEGVASGVLFDKNSSNASRSSGISIRGRSTIFANAEPLIVVDNFPFNGNINSINPNDVESVTVLKDAAAASIWGALAGNGVIVITTKRPKYNQAPRVDINSIITMGDKPDLFYDRQYIGSTDFLEVEKFLFDNNFYNSNLNNSSTRPVISPGVEIYAQLRAGAITQQQADVQLNDLKKNDVRGEYDKYFYRRSLLQQYSINLSGGSSKSVYYISAGYNKDLTNVKRNESDRVNLSSFIGFKPIKQLDVSGALYYTQTNTDNNGLTNVATGGRFGGNTYPYARFADDDGNSLPLVKDFRAGFVNNPPVQGLLDWKYFPLDELNYRDNSTKATDIRLQGTVKYQVLQGLQAEINYQYVQGANDDRQYDSPESYLMRDLVNRYSVITDGSVTGHNIPLGGKLANTHSTSISTSLRGQLNYQRQFGVHGISAIAGTDVLDTKTNVARTNVFGYDEGTGSSVSVDYSARFLLYPTGSNVISDQNRIFPVGINRFRSYFANASYTYNDRYFFTASARADQSNLFGVKTNQKTVPLWSVGGKWNISKEQFYGIRALPQLQLRVTYGENGNVLKTLTAYTTARLSGPGIFNELPYFEITSPGNPELRWERSKMFNIGIDFGSRHSFITGSVEYFRKKGVDLIGDAIIPTSTGFAMARGNYSEMKGRGIDVVLNAKIIDRAFTWNATLLFSHATDEITKNEGITGKYVGLPVNNINYYPWAGLDNTGDPVGFLEGVKTKDYSAISNEATLNPLTAYQFKSTDPQYFGAFRNTVAFKGLAVSANIIFKAGHYFRRNSISYSSLYNSSVGHSDYSRRWQHPGDELTTNVPAMVYTNYPQFNGRDGFYNLSESLIEKADFIRLQDLRLSYDIRRLGKLPIRGIQLYFYASNLGLLWKANDHGIDPDFRISGAYPNPKTYSFGLHASF